MRLGFDDADLTCDDFLNGDLQIYQPRHGYRAATDPIFLAASCPARAGQSVLELGCGVGTSILALGLRVPSLRLVGVERQTDYAELARRNAEAAGLPLEIIVADLATLANHTTTSFDHVIANPPYFTTGGGTEAADQGREAARREDTPLFDWVSCAQKRLKPKGWLTLIHITERLPEILAALHAAKFGAISILPLQSRTGQAAKRVVIRARKLAKTPAMLCPPFLIHAGQSHNKDGDDYSQAAQDVLRKGAAIRWPRG
ncbi:methyltransferase [Rhodobacteraceae bacterium XHP0102]|nr:methyltransferase [Rhodobacteraceae bacterium XHP0102]